MRRLAGVIPASLLVLAALAQEPETVFRADVKLVRILATVKNSAGQLVGGLQKDDFEVRDNDVPQEIKVFERHTEQPLSIALLFDTSGSTGIEIKYEIESVQRFLKALFKEGNPGDRLSLYTFSDDTVQQTSYTRRAADVEAALRGIRTQGGTSLYDSIFFASHGLTDREGRHVIVVVTDGGDTTSGKTFHQALEAAQRADTVIYSILVVPIKNEAGRNIGGEHALATMAARTGGRVFAPSSGEEFDEAFGDILRDLRTQYLIGFYPKGVPPSKDPFHRLEVRLKKPDLRVQSRNGYYEESEASGKGWRRVR